MDTTRLAFHPPLKPTFHLGLIWELPNSLFGVQMIETKNLFIRRFRENDRHDLQRMLANPAVMVYSGLSPFPVDRGREWLLGHIARYSDASPPGVFAIETKNCGEVIGYCGLEALPENIVKGIEGVGPPILFAVEAPTPSLQPQRNSRR